MDNRTAPFDRLAMRRHRDRAAENFAAHSFFVEEVVARLVDRLRDINRHFPTALDLGCHTGELSRAIACGRVGRLFQSEISEAMVRGAEGSRFVADEECLPLRANSLDLVASNLTLHWVNDLPGTLIQIRQALRPDGLFIAAMIGGNTFSELQQVFVETDLAVTNGPRPRVSPFADVPDLGGLLQRAGFAMPVVDRDAIEVTYSDPMSLMYDLRGMGETNALCERARNFSRREVFVRAAELYKSRYQNTDGRVSFRCEVLFMTAWAPHPAQPKPLRPGSASHRLADALAVEENPSGEVVPREQSL